MVIAETIECSGETTSRLISCRRLATDRRLCCLAIALRRGDIIFVPRSTLGELAAFFTQVRSAMPIGFSYSINGSNGAGYASF